MYIDDSDFPLVRMSTGSPESAPENAYFLLFERLLERKTPFVLLSEGGQGGDERGQSSQVRKDVSLWMKAHRQALQTYVRALIQTELNPDKRQAAQAFAPMFEKFWGYPLLVVDSPEQARSLATRLLAGEQQAR